MFNNNIRCIETIRKLKELEETDKFNNNIRCIETQKNHQVWLRI